MRHIHFLAGAAIVFIVVFWRLGEPSFWDPDEAHYAESSREMLATADWGAPYYNEEPFFDKPMLFHHLQGAAMALFGPTEFAARLVPALAALAIVLLTGWVGMTLVSRDAGVLAALLMATSPGLFGLARYAILDTLFTAFIFGGAALVTVAALRDRPWLQYPGYVLVALGVLTKGPLGLVLTGLTFLLAIVASGDARRRLLGLRWAVGLAIVLAVAAPWFAYMYRRFGEAFVAGYALDENVKLFATDRFPHQPGPGFYVRIVAASLLPWTGLLVGRLVDDCRAAWARRGPDTVEIVLWAWTAAILGFFSCSKFKLDHYAFPAAPALCLLCARAWLDVRLDPFAPEHRASAVGRHLVGPLLIVMDAVCGGLMLTRLALPVAAGLVPLALVLAGVVMTWRISFRPRRPAPVLPWTSIAAVTVVYAGLLVWVLPALETRKVVPDLARWVAARTKPGDRVAAYRLNRWNTAFRFYVNRHVAVLETVEDAAAFFGGPLSTEGPNAYGAMLEPAYQELVARGVPLQIVEWRDGMWATSGRVLWRTRVTPTRFVVVTRKP